MSKAPILQDLIPSRGGGGKCEDEAIAAQSHLSKIGLALPEARESEAVTAQRANANQATVQLHHERFSHQTAGQPAGSRSCIPSPLPTRSKGHRICDP